MRALALAALLAACGGSGVSTVSTPGTAQVSGTLGGAAFTPKSATVTYSYTYSAAIVTLHASGLCVLSPAFDAIEPNSLSLLVKDTHDSSPPVGGAYVVTMSGTRAASATYLDEATAPLDATSGTIDVTHNGTDDLRGTFDLSFQDGSKISGSFDAISCAGSQ